ncbi:MAG: hypothetical protein ACE5HY_03900 [Candidatus Hydrothermarchaeales archaeon]
MIEESRALEVLLLILKFIENGYHSSRFKDIVAMILGLFYFRALWKIFDSVNDKIAYTIIGIETGLADFNVAIFFIGSFVIPFNSKKIS